MKKPALRMITLLLSVGIATVAAGFSRGEVSRPLSPQEYAFQKLRAAGISQAYLSFLGQSYVPDERDKIVQLNVLGFLGKADYSKHYSQRAIRKCLKFLQKHRQKLKRVEASSGVPREVIAALLWVETKHGTRTGSFNISHVFFSLLQADHPEVIKATLAELSTRTPASMDENRQKVLDRSVAKSDWALSELKSLDELYQRDQDRVPKLTGSYAGAFGYPQFLPSSYLQWARPSKRGQSADLFRMEDAIQSIAFYLKSNGWKRAELATHHAALFHYNRAQGYVDVILKIAKCTKSSRLLKVSQSSAKAARRASLKGACFGASGVSS